MKLWLLRHGEAHPPVSEEALRPLTERGMQEARQAGEVLPTTEIALVLQSPYCRALETAQLALAVNGYQGAVKTVDWVIPDASPRRALDCLDTYEACGNLLLVAHQPFLGALAGLLVNGTETEPLPLATGSLLELEGPLLAAGLLTLVSAHHFR